MENVDIPVNGEKVLVFDGMAVVRCLKKEIWVKTCENLAQVFLLKTDNYLKENKYTVICIIFDPYISGQLPKIRNTKGIDGNNLVYVTDNTNIERVTLKNFLSNEKTKSDLTMYFAKKFIAHYAGKVAHVFAIAQNKLLNETNQISNITFKHNEADTLLIWFSIFCKIRYGDDISIDIICSDTDVLLLLLNFAEQIPCHTVMITASYSFPINILYKALGKQICEGLLSLHALTGSDKTGKFSGKGKVTWFHKFLRYGDIDFYVQMKSFVESKELTVETVQRISTFIAYGYTDKKLTLPEARWDLFTKLEEGEQLPPTPSSFYQHMLRACLQTFEWKNAAKTSGEILNPLEFGWYKEEDIFYPTPMTSEALPSSLLEIAFCKCKGKCNTRRCSCKRLDPPQVCTELCRCSENVDTENVCGIDSESDDEFE